MSRSRFRGPGPRFSYNGVQSDMACSACVFDQGEHTCGLKGEDVIEPLNSGTAASSIPLRNSTIIFDDNGVRRQVMRIPDKILVHVWDPERRGYLLPGLIGLTDNVSSAGLFDLREAVRITGRYGSPLEFEIH